MSTIRPLFNISYYPPYNEVSSRSRRNANNLEYTSPKIPTTPPSCPTSATNVLSHLYRKTPQPIIENNPHGRWKEIQSISHVRKDAFHRRKLISLPLTFSGQNTSRPWSIHGRIFHWKTGYNDVLRPTQDVIYCPEGYTSTPRVEGRVIPAGCRWRARALPWLLGLILGNVFV